MTGYEYQYIQITYRLLVSKCEDTPLTYEAYTADAAEVTQIGRSMQTIADVIQSRVRRA